MDIGNRIRHLRERANLTQEEVGQRIGVTKATVNRYETGNIDIKRTIAVKLADILNTTPAYIMGWTDEIVPKTPSNIIPINSDTKFVNIPIIGRVAAGTTCYADMDILGYEYVSADSITLGEDYVYLEVVGDSMYPKFEEGDLVLVKCQSSVDSGSYAVVIIDDEDGVVKKVVYGKDWIELQSINPMYPPRIFEKDDVLRVRVFGLVKEIKRKF